MASHLAGMTTLVQEREEVMVSSSPTPISRLAHFLTVSHNSIHGSSIHPPPQPVSNKESHVQLNFCRWNTPSSKWKEWVDLMYSKHQTLWKKAGILEAVLNSKYTIYRNEELLHDIAARWCSETNTFVFPWGEATLTLEDMMMLGGYSVLGKPVFSPLDTHNSKEIEKKLEHERLELCKTKAKKANHSLWLYKFMNSGNEIEHEAFLVYWLSRFVFPIAADSIMKCVIPAAIRLANGTKMALAPAVLASIYSDLTAYKIARLFSEQHLVSSPFNLIQIWVWERFPLLQPIPKNVKPEEPYFAKWHALRGNDGGIVTNVAHKEADSFIWRPYATICGEGGKEHCISVTSGTDEEVEAMIKCLRVSELVGIDSECIEQYLPHRVARQFRLDQDIPALVKRANKDQKLAWEYYNRPVANTRFCIPSHLYEPNVTVRYLEWWKKPMSAHDIETLEDGMTLWELRKRKPDDKVCDPAGNALKDCEALEDGIELNEQLLRESADEASRDNLKQGDLVTYKRRKKTLALKSVAKKDCEALEDGMTSMESARKEPNIGGSKNNLITYKRRIKSLSSVAKKQCVDVIVPPGCCLSKCSNAGARSPCAKNFKKESLCPQPTLPNVQITSEEVVSMSSVEKISSQADENEVRSVPWLCKDSLSELEARIFSVEATLARYN